MPWPIEPVKLRHFCEGLDEVLVVEERREIIENQIKQYLFNWRADVRPRIIGKFDHQDRPVLPLDRELTVGPRRRGRWPSASRSSRSSPRIAARIEGKLAWFNGAERARRGPRRRRSARLPYFCSGCPHNTSTRVPEGSRALAGIGCHFMAQWMDRRTETFTHMGAEGVPWVGTAPFTDEKHVFVNLGDGTYFHSGILAIRQAVAGGRQHHLQGAVQRRRRDDRRPAGRRPAQRAADHPPAAAGGREEGRACSSEKPDALARRRPRPRHGAPPPRRDRPRRWRSCARRRAARRSSTTRPAPPRSAGAASAGCWKTRRTRVFINHLVCEGCGDCSVQSNCVSIEPLETPLGRKRVINQSTCNKDYSCLKGFCPSFVTIEGGRLRKRRPAGGDVDPDDLPAPEVRVDLARPYNIAITGVGGTGVLTIGAILGMAAHLEGKASMILDMAGLAQKGGAVLSHVRLARDPDEVTTPRIVTGGADLLIAADSVVAASQGRHRAVRARAHRAASSTPTSRRSPTSSATATSTSARRRCRRRSAARCCATAPTSSRSPRSPRRSPAMRSRPT